MRGGVKTTFHSALKNADVQTSSSGAVASSRVYDAFGNDLSVAGSWKSPFGYAGQFGYQQDVDTSLKLLGHRYYDSDTGRFLTRDPIKDGRNWYGYCNNNPVSHVDPAGLFAFEADDAWYTRIVGFGDGIIDLAGGFDVTSMALNLIHVKPPVSVQIRELLGTSEFVDVKSDDYTIGHVVGTIFGNSVTGKLMFRPNRIHIAEKVVNIGQYENPVVIGSGGGRVKDFASTIGGETMRDLPNMSDPKRLFLNRVWIFQKATESMFKGRPIIDIGPTGSGYVGRFYKAETAILDFLE